MNARLRLTELVDLAPYGYTESANSGLRRSSLNYLSPVDFEKHHTVVAPEVTPTA